MGHPSKAVSGIMRNSPSICAVYQCGSLSTAEKKKKRKEKHKKFRNLYSWNLITVVTTWTRFLRVVRRDRSREDREGEKLTAHRSKFPFLGSQCFTHLLGFAFQLGAALGCRV
jgi:hypothetical protein